MKKIATVNRLEVIDHTQLGGGRALTKWEDVEFDVLADEQDNGGTLKIFLRDEDEQTTDNN